MRPRRTFSKSVEYLRLYLSAIAFRVRYRRRGQLSPEDALALGSTVSWKGWGLRATQVPEEIGALLEILRGERPHVLVEIGTDKGGTLLLWTHVAASDALLVAIDSRPLGALRTVSPHAIVLRSLARERQALKLLMPRNSHDPSTLAEISQLLRTRQVDFLFIDGDHSYEGVKEDFAMYAPLVRSGGLIAIHDIATEAAPGVVRFWREFKTVHAVEELVGSLDRYGIGLYRVP